MPSDYNFARSFRASCSGWLVIGSKQRLLHRELPALAGTLSRCRDPKRSKLVVRHRALAASVNAHGSVANSVLDAPTETKRADTT